MGMVELGETNNEMRASKYVVPGKIEGKKKRKALSLTKNSYCKPF